MIEGLFQPVHLIIILVIAVVLFGPGKLPELGSALGKSIREFKKASNEFSNAVQSSAAQPVDEVETMALPAVESHRVCPSCAAEISDSARFCAHCGASLSQLAAETEPLQSEPIVQA